MKLTKVLENTIEINEENMTTYVIIKTVIKLILKIMFRRIEEIRIADHLDKRYS